MAFPHKSLQAFLSHAKNQFRAAIQEQQKVTIVVGNESADLDSLSSSILYAYLRASNPPRTAFTTSYIPLLNIPASDILLRPEFLAVFNHADISASQLITLDDLPSFDEIKQKLKPANTCWILVDHNKLQGFLGTVYQDRVHGVIDHHSEENAVCQGTDPEPRVVEKCGSCTSLVVRTLRTTWDIISKPFDAAQAKEGSSMDNSEINRIWNVRTAKFALASILIDTANLTGDGKVEPADIEAAEYLESIICSSPNEIATTNDGEKYDRTRFYKAINEAKQNIDDLKLHDILRKDYKSWTENNQTLGISSVVKPLDFLIRKAKSEFSSPNNPNPLSNIIKTFMSTKNLSLFALMTTSTSPTDGSFKRELLLQAPQTILSKFLEKAGTELGLEPLTVEGLPETENAGMEGVVRNIWLQKGVRNSRKQVAPLLREVMR